MFASFKIFGRLFTLMMLCFAVAACATPPVDPDELVIYEEINDPIEPFNRSMFGLNETLDHMFFKPAALVYDGVLPVFVQDMVLNFTRYLNTPRILLNDVLQGNSQNASDTVGRFMLNSLTLGLFDPAAGAGIQYHDEDFGQTMAVWGVAEGPYLVLPIFGPKTVRSATGNVVDIYLNPINHYAENTDRNWITWTRWALDHIDWRARQVDQIDDLRETSLDFYATVRSLYRQNRQNMVENRENQNSGLDGQSLSYDFEDEIDVLDAELGTIE